MEAEADIKGYGLEPDDYHEDTMSCAKGEHNCNRCPKDRDQCAYWNNIEIKKNNFDDEMNYKVYLKPGREFYFCKI